MISSRFKFSQFKMVSFSLALILGPVANRVPGCVRSPGLGEASAPGSSAPGPPLKLGSSRVPSAVKLGRFGSFPVNFDTSPIKMWSLSPPFEPRAGQLHPGTGAASFSMGAETSLEKATWFL